MKLPCHLSRLVALSIFAAGGLTFSISASAQDNPAPEKPTVKNPDIDFVRDVKPLLEGACVQCHGPNEKELEGDYRIDAKEDAFAGGSSYGDEVIKPGDAWDSPVYWMTTLHYDDSR